MFCLSLPREVTLVDNAGIRTQTHPTAVMYLILQHLLEKNFQKQAVTQEIAQSLLAATQELLELK